MINVLAASGSADSGITARQALLAVIVGALLTALGTFIVQWAVSRRQARRDLRVERLEAFTAFDAMLDDIADRFRGLTERRTEPTLALRLDTRGDVVLWTPNTATKGDRSDWPDTDDDRDWTDNGDRMPLDEWRQLANRCNELVAAIRLSCGSNAKDLAEHAWSTSWRAGNDPKRVAAREAYEDLACARLGRDRGRRFTRAVSAAWAQLDVYEARIMTWLKQVIPHH